MADLVQFMFLDEPEHDGDPNQVTATLYTPQGLLLKGHPDANGAVTFNAGEASAYDLTLTVSSPKHKPFIKQYTP